MALEELDVRLKNLLTAEQAHRFRVLPRAAHDTEIYLWGDEASSQFLPQLRMILGRTIHIESMSSQELDLQLVKHYPHQNQGATPGQASSMAQESDVVRFVDKVLHEAAQMGASDIHVERYESEARIRYRWEGQLIEKYEVPLDQYNAIISRLKILADLDIAERRLPQDGRINLSVGQQKIDLRVSTVPGKHGEKMVLRLLTRSKEHLDLSKVGLNAEELAIYERSIAYPNGLILITGPTGSGKTTTLYASLNRLNQPTKNILTIEDPIEYNLSGINQVQLKEGIGLTFDRALRAFLRQDPDIIMVGEIRDEATAQIAIRAALTGHLVFSTLHTNSAWDALSRLTDMGVEPYLLAAALRLVVAQRLVRRLCPHCKKTSKQVDHPLFQEKWSIQEHAVPSGCPQCYYTGYRGRQAVFELLPITPYLRTQIKLGSEVDNPRSFDSNLASLEQNLVSLLKRKESSLAEVYNHIQS
ncbi:MAG: GspE/PulE family protein [Bacteroidota bacterium]